MDNVNFIGIDPGSTGAMCIHLALGVTIVVDYGDPEYFTLLRDFRGNNIACIELVGAMRSAPRLGKNGQMISGVQGVATTFAFGKAAGAAEGMLKAHGIPYYTPTPGVWQKALGLGFKHDDRKEYHRQTALQRHPDLAGYLARKKDHNRADAILIADYCRLKYGL